jgi:nucleotide-binding universal stress UspA family protein
MYKDIVVCVNEAQGRDNTIRAAARFANEVGASLTGVYVTMDSYSSPPYGVTHYGLLTKDIVTCAEERKAEQSLKAKNNFNQIADELSCNATWSEMSASDHPLRVMAYADLIITNQAAYDPRQGHSNIGFINTLVLETGKPVILIPTHWDQVVLGKKIVIGWDESREAIRAVQDAMPILKQADQVDAVTVNYKEHGDEVVDISEISSYLTRRNVSNSFDLKVTDENLDTPEKVLLDFADKKSADLIVIGGYGHTRLREIILGGTTRYLSKHSDIPVLFSH